MRRLLVCLVVPVLLLGACRTSEETTPPASEQVTLAAQNASGISGTATLTAEGNRTRVVVSLTGAVAGPHPIHIHPGTCAQLDPSPKYPLPEVTKGILSETVVAAPLAELKGGKFAINVHKSPTEAQIYVACGDIA